MTLSIIILNYRSKGLLKQCLRGIVDSHLPMTHEVIVVDNASGDGSVEMVEEHFPWAKVLAMPINGGYASGNNAGLKVATGDFLMILNPDVAVFRGAVDSLLEYAQQHPSVGIVAPKLINPDGSTQMSTMLFPSFPVALWRRTPLGNIPAVKKLIRKYLMMDWDHKSARAIGWALGACILIRRTALEQVGYFDDRFFLYLEDVDYCRRMWERGWEVHCQPAAEMVHYHRRLSADTPVLVSLFSRPARIHTQSWLKYFAKYAGAPQPPAEFRL